jgi:rhodanese-related sulfurtransferase
MNIKRAILSTVALGAALVSGQAADTQVKSESPKTQTGSGTNGFKNVGVQEFEKLRSDKQAVVLDVRTPKEFAAGHIQGATNIDVNASDFEKRVATLDTSKTYLVHCAAGVRSAKACDKLGKLNFGHLYNLEGGFKAWEKAGNKAER